MNSQEYIRALREQLALLRARHDTGAMSAPTYDVVQQLEIEISWCEHRIIKEAHL
jgi:hypothetical protein